MKALLTLFACIAVLAANAQSPKEKGAKTPATKSMAKVQAEATVAPSEFTIEQMYSELVKQWNAVNDDPFDPNKKRADRAAAVARLAEREFLIPSPKPGSEAYNYSDGSKQGLWPLTYNNGKLQFYLVEKGWPDTDYIRENAYNYWSYYSRGRRTDIKTSAGNFCDDYLDYRVYAVYSKPGKSASLSMPAVSTLVKSWSDNTIEMSGSIDVEQARALSGKLATYIKMDQIDEFDRRDVYEGGFKHRNTFCWEGNTKYISGRVSSIRVVNRETGGEVLSIKFTAWH